MTTPITRDELRARIDVGDRVVLVEALPRGYYESGHLPGALNMPHDEVDRLAPTLIPDRDAEVVVYCASPTCRNSTIAANRLTALGYRHVREYAEGKSDWQEAGLPLEQDVAAPA
jgi:rhodanese-related sulfurtransferase